MAQVYLINNCFLKIIMVSIDFCPSAPLLTSGTTLDCKMFRESMMGCPSDRHAYHLTCCIHPMRYCFLNFIFSLCACLFIHPHFMFSQGRLPYQIKNFVKFIRLAISPPPPIYTYQNISHSFCLGISTPIC